MPVLRALFPGRIVSGFADIKRSARSPDVAAVPNDFHWGYVKNKVNETRPANNDDFRQRNRECIQEIPKEMPQRVSHPYHRECRGVLTDTVVTYKVSNTKSNKQHKLSWAWYVHINVNDEFYIISVFFLFHFKNHRVFLAHPVEGYGNEQV